MSSLSIGLSAVTVSQRLLDITGQNIANAATPGYHRQTANLAARNFDNPLGAGVYITDIRRSRSALLESAVIRNTVEEQSVTAQLDSMRQLEVFLAPGEGGVDGLIEKFFNDVQQLASRPGDLAQRRVVLGTARGLTDRLTSATDELRKLGEDLDARAGVIIGSINTYAKQIADLNGRIQRGTLLGQPPNDLLDQRDQLVAKMAELVDVRVIDIDYGEINVIAAGAPVVIGAQNLDLRYQVDASNEAVFVRTDGSGLALNVTGGQAAGILQVRNGDLADIRTRLDELSRALVSGVDAVHSTGLGLTGPLTSAAGGRGVNNPAIPLATTNLAFPPRAGDLYVSVTDTATGARTLHRVAIDPAVQSLNDVATALSGLPNLTASVDPATNGLRIVADPGFAFDFAGRLPSAPENVAVTGTSVPQLTGTYTGATNDTYTYTVVGTGTVGQTAGLTLEVRDAANTLLGSFNVGAGYEPGSALPAVNGVAAKLGAGTLNAGDTFETRVVADADTAELLPALGVNTFFVGDSASTLAVRPDLLSNPELLAASRTGDVGDASNLVRLARLRDARPLAGGTQSLREFHASLVADVGVRVQTLSSEQDAKQALGQNLEAQRQAVSGVDPNEELVRLLQYQRQFEMAARYIAVVNETLDSLLQLAS